MYQPKIQLFEPRKIIGVKQSVKLADQKIPAIWSSFRKMEPFILNRTSENYFSIQEYPVDYFHAFSPDRFFTKWAAAEVSSIQLPPDTSDVGEIPGGWYALFNFVGTPGKFPAFFQWILGDWLPGSEYELDHRPHFEELSKSYRPDDPNAHELVYIPIRFKSV